MEVDIEDWSTSDDWKNLFYKGSRKFATNHLMGNGYWIWIIPLVSGSTSIGIVADPRILPFEKINSLHKCLSWMKEEEPLLHSRLISHPDKILDFKMMKDFALDSVHYYSKDRWALSGEAASFTDAFYSPGLDFIALGNTWISSLILSDSKGMDIYAQSMIYELMHKRLFSGWLTLYQDQYSALGNTALMLMKVIWDWSAYWSIQCLMFKNHGYTDVGIIKEFSSQNDQLGQRFAILNQSMQNLFKDWNQEAAFSFA
jgi:flavin-dependent dehydrogenase